MIIEFEGKSQDEVIEALYKTADQIEQYPTSYRFFDSRIPHPQGRGCVLGWTAYFLSFEEGICFQVFLKEEEEVETEFYQALRDHSASVASGSSDEIAAAIRQYIDQEAS